jgi:diguanylate cyclase (GGDEF)-like protein/PAS domain S-box-containing protein
LESSDQATREQRALRADKEFSKRILQGSLLPFLLILVIAAATPYRVEHPDVLWAFAALLLGLGIARVLCGLAFEGLYRRRPLVWRRLAQAGAYASAGLWGTFAAVTLALHKQHDTAWYTLLLSTGLAAGASVSLAPYPSLAWHYVLILLGPIIVIALVQGSVWGYGLAGVVALYLVFLIGQSRSSSRWFWHAVTQEEEQHAHSRKLEERTAYLDALIRESPLAIVALDPAQNIRMCNPAFERLFQYRQEEIAGRNLDELIQTEESAEETVRLSQQALEGVPVHATTRRKRKDGSLVDVELHGVPLVQDGKLMGLFALYEDITERREAEARLEEAHQSLGRRVAELHQLTGEINALSEMGSFLQSCHTAQEAYTVVGRSASRLFANDWGALYMISPSRDVLARVATWGGSGTQQSELAPGDCWAMRMGQIHARIPGAGEPPCWHIADPEAEPTVCVPLVAQGETLGMLHLGAQSGIADMEAWVASRKRLGAAFAEEVALAVANLNLREKLQAQSIRDPLTGLFNRRYMEESLERELRRATRHGSAVSVLMVDLDHFKQFNDTFGHDAGDMLLGELGRTLRQQVRGEDIVCRYGGEEFAIILPDTPTEDAQRRAEQLRQAAMRLEVRHQGQELGVITLSIGAASYPLHAGNAEGLLRAADKALYGAKAGGRNRVVTAEAEGKAVRQPAAPVAN